MLSSPENEPDDDDDRPSAPEPPIVVATPELPRDRRKPIAIVAAALAIVAASGLALGLEGRAIARDEEQLWSTASSTEGTEEDWARYVAFADALRDGGLRAMLATRLTAVWARAPLAEENVLVARAESALTRGDWNALCALRAEHPGTRGADRALALSRGRRDTDAAGYATRAGASGLDSAGVSVVLAAIVSSREEDPCALGGTIRFTRTIADDEGFARSLPGGRALHALLADDDIAPRTVGWTDTLSGELAAASGIPLTSDTPNPQLVVDVASVVHGGSRVLTASGSSLPGLMLDGTIRLFVRPPHGVVPSTPMRTATFHFEPTSSRALAFADAHTEAELGAIYESMIAELESAMIDRVRYELGIGHLAGHVRSASDCIGAEPLPIGRVVHGSTRHLFDDTYGGCSVEHENALEWADCEDCWEDDHDPPASPEAVYRLALTERRRVSIQADADDGRTLVVYVRESCAEGAAEIACDADLSPIDEVFEPGLYFVFVDETGGGAGRFDLVVTLHDPDRPVASCTSASLLTSGVAVSGDTTHASDDLADHCGGVGGHEAVHAIDVDASSRLRCHVTADFGAVLDTRDACDAATRDIACVSAADELRAEIEPGRHLVVVDGEDLGAAGTYTLTCETAPIAGGVDVVDVVADSCASPGTIGTAPITVDTLRAHDDLRASCGTTDGPDLVYRIDVATRSHLHAVAVSPAGTVLSLRARCGEVGSEIACNASSVMDADVAPGSYYLVVDGARTTFAARTVTVTLTDLATVCAAATPLPLGPSSGTTRGGSSYFAGTCVAPGPEVFERLVLPARSHVVIRSQQQFEGGIYVRRDCADWSTELACSRTDGTLADRSMVDLTLDAGTYYVFVDGERANQAGTFTIDVQATAI